MVAAVPLLLSIFSLLHLHGDRVLADDDAAALVKFKQTLHGNSKALAEWTEGGKPCPLNRRQKWPGVICSNDLDGRVTGLQLENMGLVGLVDVNALLSLDKLRTLSLSGNNFEGQMPNISRIGALRAVFLSRNNFSGVIPDDAFDHMGSLKKVVLSSNQFSGPIPASLGRVSKLVELWLDDNKFTGQIPDLLQPNLTVVNFSNNYLFGTVPENLARFGAGSYSGNSGLCGEPLDRPCKKKKVHLSRTLLILIIVSAAVFTLGLIGSIWALFHCRPSASSHNQNLPTKSTAKKAAVFKAGRKLGKDSPKLYTTTGGKIDTTLYNVRTHENGKLVFLRDGEQRFGLKDLLRASAQVLDGGSFGSSYKAMLLSGQSMVVKRFKGMNAVGLEEFDHHMMRLGRLDHPNILPLGAYYYRREERLLVMEYVENGNLEKLLHSNDKKSGLEWAIRLSIIKGVARGLAYLHTQLSATVDVPHGHLKSSNVLLGNNFEPLLMDYALLPVTNTDAAKQHMVAFKSPEYKKHRSISPKSDVWNLGTLILEILTGRYPENYGADHGRWDLAQWVSSVVREEWTGEVFDKGMVGGQRGELGEMLKLLQIGLACCEARVSKRWGLQAALEKIEEVSERGHPDESSYATDDPDMYSSRALITDDDFSFSVAH